MGLRIFEGVAIIVIAAIALLFILPPFKGLRKAIAKVLFTKGPQSQTKTELKWGPKEPPSTVSDEQVPAMVKVEVVKNKMTISRYGQHATTGQTIKLPQGANLERMIQRENTYA
jgi:hypothetical protein